MRHWPVQQVPMPHRWQELHLGRRQGPQHQHQHQHQHQQVPTLCYRKR